MVCVTIKSFTMNVVIIIFILLSVVMLRIVVLSVVLLSVIGLSVVAPQQGSKLENGRTGIYIFERLDFVQFPFIQTYFAFSFISFLHLSISLFPFLIFFLTHILSYFLPLFVSLSEVHSVLLSFSFC
jgi:hypothetical protein